MSTRGSGASRPGEDPLHNEDAFLVEDGLGLYVVCDGAGGRPAGEIASELAVQALETFVGRAGPELGERLWQGEGPLAVVERGLRFALDAVLETARGDPQLEGMATTCTMLLAHGDRGVFGHAGDSRAYLIRRARAYQLTVDHELTDSPSDATDDASIDVFSIALQPRDTLVLCTDGAEEVVQEPTIARTAAELSPPLLASRIVSTAHRWNPQRDATAVVIRVRGERELGWLELSAPPQGVAFGHTLAVA